MRDAPTHMPSDLRPPGAENGTRALIAEGEDAFAAASGTNPLDPATRAPSARAGQERGAAVAAQVASLWAG